MVFILCECIFSPVAVPYEVTFFTGSQSGAETDALVYLQMFGNKGAKKTETLLFNRTEEEEEAGHRSRAAFARASSDTFNVRLITPSAF